MNFLNLFVDFFIAKVARDHPMNYFDIGSRDGFQEDLFPLAFAVNAIGFEPEPSEFNKLRSQVVGPWLTTKFLPFGVSGKGGRQKLFIPRDPQSSSLLRHNKSLEFQFNKEQSFEVKNTIEIETRTLSEAFREAKVKSVDYLKIDIEGAELEVFQSSPQLLDSILAVKTEVSFIEFRHEQPLAFEVDKFMTERGFMLMDLVQPSHWRRKGYVIHPYTSNENPPYSKGQIIHGDYLYFRDPESLRNEPEAQIKLGLISMAFGYFDYALMVLEKKGARKYLAAKYDETVLDIIEPASKAYGRKIFWATLYNQFRGLIPMIRYSKNILKKSRGLTL